MPVPKTSTPITNSTRRAFLWLCAACIGVGALGLLGPLGCSANRQEAVSAKKPNIVVFLTDDESWLERSAYGWSKLPTPHFGRVAKEGVIFTFGYTSAPSCAPSRASLLTGRNFWELEQGAMIQAWLPKKFPVLPDLLAENGYHTGHTGKGWGPGVYPDGAHGPDSTGPAYNDIQVEQPQEDINPIDYPANFAKFLDARSEGQPFFFWVGVTEPHAAWAEDNHRKLAEKYGVTLDDITVPGFMSDTPAVRRRRANMLYEVCYADDQLGKILGILEQRGELDNTLLIATSDNGTAISRSKATVYDWGVHEPLAIMWPARVKGDRTVEDFVKFPDLTPTMLEAAGVPIPPEMSGRSILDILLSDQSGQVDPSRDWIATGLEWHGEFDPISRAGRMIRDKRYEYIVNYGNTPGTEPDPLLSLPDSDFPRPAEELYDLEKDPWQIHNVIDDPEYAEVKERLKAKLKAYQIETKDPRATGDMKIFEETRQFVQERKRAGYPR